MSGPWTEDGRKWIRWLAWISLVATGIGLLSGEQFVDPAPTTTDSYGKGPLGHRAFVETLQTLGVHVSRQRRGRLEETRHPLWIIEPGREKQKLSGRLYELDKVLEERQKRELFTVVVLPKWRFESSSGEPRAVPDEAHTNRIAELLEMQAVHRGDSADGSQLRPVDGPLATGDMEVPWPQLVEAESLQPLLQDEQGGVLVGRRDYLFVVADPDLLHNFNLHRQAHAEWLVDMVRTRMAADAIVIDEIFHGHGQERSLLRAMGQRPALWATLHLVLVCLLLVMAGSRRFGPPREIEETTGRGPRKLIEVASGVLAAGQRPNVLAASYTRQLLEDLAQRLRISARTPAERAESIDRIAQRRGLSLRAVALLKDADQLEASSVPLPRSMEVARRAHDLYRQLAPGHARTDAQDSHGRKA